MIPTQIIVITFPGQAALYRFSSQQDPSVQTNRQTHKNRQISCYFYTRIEIDILLSDMEEEDNPTKCSCRVKLGIVQLRPQDVQESKDFETKYKLVNQAIHFLGSCNLQEKCTIQDKIDEVRKQIGRFYFDKDERLIAIPNQISMSKNETPRIISGKSKQNDKFYDKNYEDRLHQQLVIALRNKKAIALVLEGFQSENCLQPKIEKSRSVRGKYEYAEINCEEKELMKILEIPSIKKKDLALCVEKHKTSKFNLKEDDGKSWLFKKVIIISCALKLYFILYI